MPRLHPCTGILLTAALAAVTLHGQTVVEGRLLVEPGSSAVVDCAADVQRVAVANPAVAEVMAVSAREVLVNALAPGKTNLLIWLQTGARLSYEVTVPGALSPIGKLSQRLADESGDEQVKAEIENGTVFLTGTAKDQSSADRAALIAGVYGKVVNLLYVDVPHAPAQILLKVRFANVDRSASKQLGANLISTGAGHTLGQSTTGQQTPAGVQTQNGLPSLSLSDALNLFLFRSDLNLGATIRALQSKNLLEILAEPNVLTMDRKRASFVAGGEFPFPTVQGGANAGAVTISFREFGIRIGFLPEVTPRGTIQLHVTPEVSSLDFANGLIFQGSTIPALSTRRVETDVELESGQSFAIAGLLDNRVTESLSKIPGLSSIPLLGKLFESMSRTKSNTELIVIVTPELVLPVPAGKPLPQVNIPETFLDGTVSVPPQTPGPEVTGPAPRPPRKDRIPIEQLRPRPLSPADANASPAGLPGSMPGSAPAPLGGIR